MGALVLALVIWRVDVVRLLPQTAAFYQGAGLAVNLRGLVFKDVKITNETVEGKPALVIEGMIEGRGQKPVELPRLRFSVRDAHGVEIYAWNAILVARGRAGKGPRLLICCILQQAVADGGNYDGAARRDCSGFSRSRDFGGKPPLPVDVLAFGGRRARAFHSHCCLGWPAPALSNPRDAHACGPQWRDLCRGAESFQLLARSRHCGPQA